MLALTPSVVIVRAMRLLLAPLAAALLLACSSTPDAEAPKKPVRASQDDAPPKVDDAPPGTVARRAMDAVLLRRPGYVLSRVQIEEVLRQNKFVGWRLASFPAEWDKTGLQPGDVVTEVNGIALEKPEDLWSAWMAMAEATELRIGFERDGKPAVTVVKIHGAPVPETKVALESGTGVPTDAGPPDQKRQGPRERRKDTIVITDETSNTDDDTSSMYY